MSIRKSIKLSEHHIKVIERVGGENPNYTQSIGTIINGYHRLMMALLPKLNDAEKKAFHLIYPPSLMPRQLEYEAEDFVTVVTEALSNPDHPALAVLAEHAQEQVPAYMNSDTHHDFLRRIRSWTDPQIMAVLYLVY